MVDRVVILSARRSYEFRPDSVRLTMLSTGEVRNTIQQSFDFQLSEIAPPPETFGAVPTTDPPGLVFRVGSVAITESNKTPIRFLHIEAQRVIIDVAGHSSAIDAVWQQLRQGLADLQAPDGAPALGEPIRQAHHSEITAHLDIAPDTLLAPALRAMLSNSKGAPPADNDLGLVSAISFRMHPASRTYSGLGGTSSFRLEPRAGEPPNQHIYYSVTPLPSEAHLAYLQDLEAALAMPVTQDLVSTAPRRARRKPAQQTSS